MEYNRIINPNQLTGFYMRGTLAFNGLNPFNSKNQRAKEIDRISEFVRIS